MLHISTIFFSNYWHMSDTKVIHSIRIFDLFNCATKSVTIKVNCNVYFDRVTWAIFHSASFDGRVILKICVTLFFEVEIVTFDEEPSTPSSAETNCYQKNLARALPENLETLERFVNNVWISDGPNANKSVYSKAFYTAFQYFINSPNSDPRRKYVIYACSTNIS